MRDNFVDVNSFSFQSNLAMRASNRTRNSSFAQQPKIGSPNTSLFKPKSFIHHQPVSHHIYTESYVNNNGGGMLTPKSPNTLDNSSFQSPPSSSRPKTTHESSRNQQPLSPKIELSSPFNKRTHTSDETKRPSPLVGFHEFSKTHPHISSPSNMKKKVGTPKGFAGITSSQEIGLNSPHSPKKHKNSNSNLNINITPTLPNRFTYEGDDLLFYLNYLKNCKKPYYPLTPQEIEKRKQVYSTYAFIMSTFHYYDKNNNPDSNNVEENSSNPNVSYGHPQDIFQISCYLLKEVLNLNNEMDHLKYQLNEKDKRIHELEEKYETKSEYDLIKARPSKLDMISLQESISRLEDEILKHDPILFKEKKEQMEEDQMLFEINGKDNQFVNVKQATPPLPSLLRNGRKSNNSRSSSASGSSRPPSVNSVTSDRISVVSDGDDSSISLSQSLTQTEVQEYVQAIKNKMKLLENFIFVLKKKAQRLEQTDLDLKKLVLEWGTLHELLEENKRMKTELKFFGWVTERFDTDMLLNHKYLYIEDTTLLKSVIFALQNELYETQKALKYYNDVENKTLKLLTSNRGSEVHPKQVTLEYLMADLFYNDKQKFEYEQKKKESKKNETQKKETEDELSVMDLRRSLRYLEHENEILKTQVRRLEQQVESQSQALTLFADETPKHKKIEVKERETMIKKLEQKLDILNKNFKETEHQFLFQEELVKSITEKRDKLYLQNAQLNSELIEKRNELYTLRKKVVLQSEGLKTMYEIASSVLYYFLNDMSSEERKHVLLNGENNLKMVFRDLFSHHLIKTNAAIKIQSWIRGIRARRKLCLIGNCSVFVIRMLKKRKQKDSTALVVQSKKERNNDLLLFSTLENFMRITSACSNLSTGLMKEFTGVISSFRDEILHSYKQQVIQDMNAFKKQQEELQKQIIEQVHNHVYRPMSERSTQTDGIEKKTRGIQSGVSNISTIEIRSNPLNK
ncbi:hypothetical protein ABK040_004661 [Willaertia magna]